MKKFNTFINEASKKICMSLKDNYALVNRLYKDLEGGVNHHFLIDLNHAANRHDLHIVNGYGDSIAKSISSFRIIGNQLEVTDIDKTILINFSDFDDLYLCNYPKKRVVSEEDPFGEEDWDD